MLWVVGYAVPHPSGGSCVKRILVTGVTLSLSLAGCPREVPTGAPDPGDWALARVGYAYVDGAADSQALELVSGARYTVLPLGSPDNTETIHPRVTDATVGPDGRLALLRDDGAVQVLDLLGPRIEPVATDLDAIGLGWSNAGDRLALRSLKTTVSDPLCWRSGPPTWS